MSKLKKYGLVALLLAVAFSAGRFSAPMRVTEKESEHSTKEKNESKNKNSNTVETEKETRLPDGTIIKERTKEKKTSTETNRKENSETSKERSKTVENRPSYRVGAIYEPALKGFQEVSYSLILEKRIFSEVYIGVAGSSDRTFGVTLSLGF